ncbi:MAG: ATP-binding protein [Syntrophales bacterium]|nr:ATP-binding protein [Syntrophales bacterium]
MIKINSLHDLHDETILEELISGGETSTLEFIRDIIDPNNAAKLMSSFANTDGGIILFGIDDGGIIRGIKDAEQFNDFAQKAFVKTASRITGYSFGVTFLKEKPLGCILVWPQRGLPVSVNSQYFRRVGHQTIAFRLDEFEKVIQEREEPTTLFISQAELQSFMELADEDTFTEILLVPIMRKLGFSCVLAKGHSDKSLEYGQDIRCFKFQIPTGHWLYFAAQVKAGSISYSAKEPTKNIEQILTQVKMAQNKKMFDYETNRYHKPDNVIFIASGKIVEGARSYLCEQLSEVQSQRILFWDSNLILERSEKVGLPAGVQYEIRNFLIDKKNNDRIKTSKTPEIERLGEFMSKWVLIEQSLYRLAELTYPDHKEGQRINIGPIPNFLARDKIMDKSTTSEIERLRQIRNQVVHGEIEHKVVLTVELMTSIQKLLAKLEVTLFSFEKKKE